MKKIIAFAGSNSSTSINYQLVKYTANLLEDADVQILNMAEMPFPIYSEDTEKKDGFKNSLVELHNDIQEADGLIIGVNEHNGSISAYFKNLIDWLSRFNRNFLVGKKVFVLSTSTGKFGGSKAVEAVKLTLPFFGAEIYTTFSLPLYMENFSSGEGILNEELKVSHGGKLQDFAKAL
ncbi:NAD(P)H-dependent FMN reductase [Pustulibacterium marinum]|uniref:NAD(P)H-dependent FMN reductase n=1 Tax=Pustulibacterium marinum TaxID=1224947 RepID=A0A1I7FNN1_9FLAO|nr:NAD(P)H-dependent oxidoreductase [Pustulibacterium marinum]SFU37794.1 NAD(P)H-dependent FMN reductase [Pustulibacterium marinum]